MLIMQKSIKSNLKTALIVILHLYAVILVLSVTM